MSDISCINRHGEKTIVVPKMSFRVSEFQDQVETAFKQIIAFAKSLDLVENLGISDYLQRLLEYTVSGGKHLRSCLSLSIASSYPSSKSSSGDISAQAIVALTMEIVFSYFFSF